MPYPVVLWLFGALAIAIVPLVTLVYRLSTVRRRAREILIRMWDKDAIAAYLLLFKPGNPETVLKEKDEYGKVRDLDTVVMDRFYAVHDPKSYAIGIGTLTFAVALSVFVCLSWVDGRMKRPTALSTIESTHILALAGAYVWCVFEMLSRIRSRNLTPDDLTEMTLRFIAAVPIGYAFSLVSVDKVQDAFAFVAAAFPLREARLWFLERTLKGGDAKAAANPAFAGGRVSDGHIGTTIDGISDTMVATLQDAGFATYMDLAYADPIRVMARMGQSLRLVLAWIDQCLLAVYAPALKGQFARAGIPCALDADEFFKAHGAGVAMEKWKSDATVVELAAAVKLAPELLYGILERVHNDPHVRFLDRVWNTNAEAVTKWVAAPDAPGGRGA